MAHKLFVLRSSENENTIMNKANACILKVIKLCEALLSCADSGDLAREDETCGVLFGIVRDCSYKMLHAAENEQLLHIARGTWDTEQ